MFLRKSIGFFFFSAEPIPESCKALDTVVLWTFISKSFRSILVNSVAVSTLPDVIDLTQSLLSWLVNFCGRPPFDGVISGWRSFRIFLTVDLPTPVRDTISRVGTCLEIRLSTLLQLASEIVRIEGIVRL